MVVQKFCGLFDLSLGTYLAGFLSIILSIVTIFKLPPPFPDGDEDNDGVTDSPVTESPVEEDKSDALLGVFLTFVVFGLIFLVCSGLLIFGAFKRVSKFVVPWLASFIFLVVLLFFLEILPEFIDEPSAWYFIFLVIFSGVSVYLWLVVYSFYKEVADEELNLPV